MPTPAVCTTESDPAREDIDSWRAGEDGKEKLKTLADGFRRLADQDVPGKFDFVSAIHGFNSNLSPWESKQPQFFAEYLGGPVLRHCDHGDKFFAWHRAYLLAMEHNLRVLVGDHCFRLPYWDWYTQPSIPEAFRCQGSPNDNPLCLDSARNPEMDGGEAVWKPAPSQFAWDEPEVLKFETFQEGLQLGEHDRIHGGVGSNFDLPAHTARDPLFWIHHANVDRMLVVWLNQPVAVGEKYVVGDYGKKAWDDRVPRYAFPLKTATGWCAWRPGFDDLQMESSKPGGFRYANLDPPKKTTSPSAPVKPPAAVPAGNAFFAFSLTESPSIRRSGLIVRSTGTTILLPSRPQFRIPRRTRVPLSLVFEDLLVLGSEVPVVSYEVYVNLPAEGASPADIRRHYLGAIGLFGLPRSGSGGAGQSHSDHAGMGRFPLIPIKHAFDESADTLSVSLVPATPFPDRSYPDQPILRIGRLGLEPTGTE